MRKLSSNKSFASWWAVLYAASDKLLIASSVTLGSGSWYSTFCG